MSALQEKFTRIQAALAQLSAPPTTTAVLDPGPERHSIIKFLLQKLLSPELVNKLEHHISHADVPAWLSPEEAQAHRLARMLQYADFHVPVDIVRGSCEKLDDSMHLLTELVDMALAHQQYTGEAATTTTVTANTSTTQQQQGSGSTPRQQRTPSRLSGGGGGGGGHSDGGGGAGGGGSGRPLLGLHSLQGELRLLDGLSERLPQLLDASGGGNWLPGDIMAVLQLSYLSTQPTLQELAAAVEQRSAKLRAELPGLRAAEARLAAELNVASDAEWQQHAEATRAELEGLLQSSAAFFDTFQNGLGVWCTASRPADTCNLGPMASELLQRYATLRQLGSELSRVRQAHASIVNSAPPLTMLEPQSLSQVVRAGQSAVETLQRRIEEEQRVLTEAEAVVAAARARATRVA